MKKLTLPAIVAVVLLLSYVAYAAVWQKASEGKCGVAVEASDHLDNDLNGLVDDCSSANDALVVTGTGHLALARDFVTVPPAAGNTCNQLIDDATVDGGKIFMSCGDNPLTSGMATVCGTFTAGDKNFWALVKVNAQRTNTLWVQMDSSLYPAAQNAGIAHIPLGNQTSSTYVWEPIGVVATNAEYLAKTPSSSPKVFALTADRHCLNIWPQKGVRIAAIGAVIAGHDKSDFLPGGAAPVISALDTGTASPTSRTVTWVTDINADTQMFYGLTSSYGNQTALLPTLVTAHSASIVGGLTPSTTYHFKVCSSANSQTTCSTDSTFATSASTGTTGTIAVETVGDNANANTAPYVTVQIDALTAAVRATTASGLAEAPHTVLIGDVPGQLAPKYGTCSYAEGAAACQVTSFPSAPTCNGTVCSVSINVCAGIVTKVVFQDVGVPKTGYAANADGGKNGTVVVINTLADLMTLETTYVTGGYTAVFANSGPFVLPHQLLLTGGNITIDGYTAPNRTVTFQRYGITLAVVDRVGVEHPNTDVEIRGIHVDKQNYVAGQSDLEWNAIAITSAPPGSQALSGLNVVDTVSFHHNSVLNCYGSCVIIKDAAKRVDITDNIVHTPTLLAAAIQGLGFADGHTVARNVIMSPLGISDSFAPTNQGAPTLANHIVSNLLGLSQNSAGQFYGMLFFQGGNGLIENNTFLPLDNSVTLGTINLSGNATTPANQYKLNNDIIVCNPGANWKSGSAAQTSW